MWGKKMEREGDEFKVIAGEGGGSGRRLERAGRRGQRERGKEIKRGIDWKYLPLFVFF